MLRKTVGGLALTALLATGAMAQSPFQEGFSFVSGNSDFTSYLGQFTDPANIAKTGEVINTPFEVWCVDPMNFVYGSGGPAEPLAWVTPITATDFSHTLDRVTQSSGGDSHTGVLTNALAQADYWNAAWLASNMTSANNQVYENAIWQVMGYTFTLSGGVSQANVNTAKGLINTSDKNFNASDWAVITNNYASGKECFPNSPYCQEFLYYNPKGIPESVVPEPATMSLMAMGLIGITGASLRRRRQRIA